jgi:hypothetical protein
MPTNATTEMGLGYVRWSPGSGSGSATVIAEGIAQMEAFARTCGYVLGDVFVDDDPLVQLGWESLLNAVRATRPVSVLVPDVPELRLPLDLLRPRLRRVTSAPLVVARPEVVWRRDAMPSPADEVARREVRPSSGTPAARRATRVRRAGCGRRGVGEGAPDRGTQLAARRHRPGVPPPPSTRGVKT